MTAVNFRFNIRVYALIINVENEVLLVDEYLMDQYMTKFPGGGLEFGEGTIDCLKREAIEELNREIEILEHFYTTDFYQKALFFENTQLISIYYLAKLKEVENNYPQSLQPSILPAINGSMEFRWVPLKKLNADQLSFPIDKHVVKLIKEKFGGV